MFEKHCWAEIDLDALRHNFELIRERVGGSICAVVKADAYGHGAVRTARTLQDAGAAAFAVSCAAEGIELRRGGITRPILILGYADASQAAALAENRITTAVLSLDHAKALSAAAAAAGVTVQGHLKLDTGMGRIGFVVRSEAELQQALPALKACYALPGLKITGVFQHFAAADSVTAENERYTDAQHALFAETVRRLQAAGLPAGTVHCANSAAQMRRPEWRCDLVRAGIILYGLDPSDEVHIPGLRPVMTLKTVVSQVKTLYPGESVSYGRTFEARQPMQAATVCVGYADGYPRLLSGSQRQGLMLVNGHPAPVLGRVCMDQTLLDVTGIPGVKMGDEVTVFGPRGADTADSIARKTGTINYEVVCGVARRVPRVYLKNNEATEIWNDLED